MKNNKPKSKNNFIQALKVIHGSNFNGDGATIMILSAFWVIYTYNTYIQQIISYYKLHCNNSVKLPNEQSVRQSNKSLRTYTQTRIHIHTYIYIDDRQLAEDEWRDSGVKWNSETACCWNLWATTAFLLRYILLFLLLFYVCVFVCRYIFLRHFVAMCVSESKIMLFVHICCIFFFWLHICMCVYAHVRLLLQWFIMFCCKLVLLLLLQQLF